MTYPQPQRHLIKGKSGRQYDWDDLLYRDELADALHVSPGYISAMKRLGFVMPALRATVNEARRWILENHKFKCSDAYPCMRKKKIKPIDPRQEELTITGGKEKHV